MEKPTKDNATTEPQITLDQEDRLVAVDQFLEELKNKMTLNEFILSEIEGSLSGVILGSADFTYYTNGLDQLDITSNNRSTIIELSKNFLGIKEEVITSSVGEVVQKEAQVATVSPLQALASIKERLAQKTTVSPVKRDYSIEKAPQTTPVEKRIDPYRELPEA